MWESVVPTRHEAGGSRTFGREGDFFGDLPEATTATNSGRRSGGVSGGHIADAVEWMRERAVTIGSRLRWQAGQGSEACFVTRHERADVDQFVRDAFRRHPA